jgi:hypothetical protein
MYLLEHFGIIGRLHCFPSLSRGHAAQRMNQTSKYRSQHPDWLSKSANP